MMLQTFAYVQFVEKWSFSAFVFSKTNDGNFTKLSYYKKKNVSYLIIHPDQEKKLYVTYSDKYLISNMAFSTKDS